eukprot:1160590-Pelagomonas_calceolata.AAC.12
MKREPRGLVASKNFTPDCRGPPSIPPDGEPRLETQHAGPAQLFLGLPSLGGLRCSVHFMKTY